MNSSLTQEDVIGDVIEERERQDAMFGEQNHHPAYWLALLGKQMGQLGDKIVAREWSADRTRVNDNMREEAVQLAAVAVAFVEAIDRGEVPDTLTTSKPQDPRQLAKALDHGHEAMQYDLGGEG